MSNVLRVSQNDNGEELREVIMLVVGDLTWDRLQRIFYNIDAGNAPLHCYLDWLDDTGDTILEDPIIIKAHQARWLLRDFFGLPEREWGLVKIPE